MKIQRLLIILFYLLSHERVKIDELCKCLEVSPRTVYRDLDILRTAGVEIDSFIVKKGGICLSKNFSMDQLLLNKNEWNALMFNSLCMSQFKNTKFAAEAKELYNKLSVLFLTTADVNKNANVLIDMSYKYQGDELKLKIRDFEAAIDNSQLLQVCYNSPFCEYLSTDGLVAPYGLVNKVGYWYLVGFCHIHHIFRAFNMAYIKSYELSEEHFQRDTSFVLEEFWEKSNPR
jgi:predicted DNA-binding transcriptional regulator YafY